MSSHPLCLSSLRQNRSCSWIPIRCRERSTGSPHHDWVSLEMYFEAMIERVWRCTWRMRRSELRDALGGCNRASFGMHFEAEIKRIQIPNWRPWSSEIGDAHGGRNWVNSRMHMGVGIERGSGCPCRPRLSTLRDVIGGRDRVSFEMHLEAGMKQVWICTRTPWSIVIGGVLRGRRSGRGGSERRHNGSWYSIHWLTCKCGTVENWVQQGQRRDEWWDWLGARDSRSWDDAVLNACCTQC